MTDDDATTARAAMEQLMRDLDMDAQRLFVLFVQKALLVDFPTAAEIMARLERRSLMRSLHD